MLANFPILAFIGVTDLDAAATFYGGTLGLRRTDQIPGMVAVFDAGGTSLRVTVVPGHVPSPATVAGWSVPDIAAMAASLRDHGITLLRYDGLDADELGVWAAPGGDRVCWFHDPAGNVLSLTEFARRSPTRAREVAPVLPVRSVEAALARFVKLGFAVSAFKEPGRNEEPLYGFAERDGVHFHVAHVQDLDPSTSIVSVYLYVEDADALHSEWTESGVEGRLHEPTTTGYGLREGAYVDPDGNLIRYGSFVGSA